jgi:hypothetical protein
MSKWIGFGILTSFMYISAWLSSAGPSGEPGGDAVGFVDVGVPKVRSGDTNGDFPSISISSSQLNGDLSSDKYWLGSGSKNSLVG